MRAKPTHNFFIINNVLLFGGICLLLCFNNLPCIHAQVINTPDITIKSANNITHSENSVFISPNDKNIILNSNNRSGFPTIGSFSVSGQISLDGGLSWPFGVSGNLNNSFADPAVAIDNNGRFFVGYVNTVFGQSISYSDDNGTTWFEKVVIPGTFSIFTVQDKNHLWIDNKRFKTNGASNLFEGNVYSAWTDFNGVRHILFSKSVNNGLNWSTAVDISSGTLAGYMDHGVNIQTGPNGEVYACWAVYDSWPSNEVDIGFAKSLDGGIIWDAAARIQNINGHRITPLGGSKTMRHNSFPVMTVNQQNGEIYIVWTELVASQSDIYMIKSSDNGNNWSLPIKVNQDFTNNDQWFPWIACDEVSGALAVIYYDSRINNSQAETYVSISYDGGDTWNDFLISDVPWSGDGFVSSYAGDYLGIDVFHGKAVPVWSDDRTGNMLAYTQPFDIPCPDDLTLCNATITDVAVYKVNNSITVGGPGCNYTILSTGDVKMQAGTEIVISGEFVAEGEFYALIDPACPSFSEKMASTGNYSGISNTSIIETTEQSMVMSNNPINIYPNPTSGIFTLSIRDDKPTEKIYIASSSITASNNTSAGYNDDALAIHPSMSVAFINNVQTINIENESSDYSNNLPYYYESSVYIYDIFGRLIEQLTMTNVQLTIDISEYGKGIYFVKVVQGEEVFTEKIIHQ